MAGDTWTLTLSLAHECGLRWYSAASDRGTTTEQGQHTVALQGYAQRDV
jgi:hypothetical protein